MRFLAPRLRRVFRLYILYRLNVNNPVIYSYKLATYPSQT